MRILKDYSAGEREEFKSIKAIYDYPFAFLTNKKFEDDCPNLSSLIRSIDNGSDDKQLLQDIADYINDKAEFADPKYYVKLPKVMFPYLIQTKNGSFDWCNRFGSNEFKYQFTMEEIEAIDPRYMAFAVPVEVDNE